MHKTNFIVNSMCREFLASSNAWSKGETFLQLDPPSSQEGKSERFHITYSNRTFRIQADSPLAAVFGISQLQMAYKGGYWPELLGDTQPHFALRPLWIPGTHLFRLADEILLALPPELHHPSEPYFSSFCQRLLELGMNSVVLGHYGNLTGEGSRAEKIDLSTLCSAFHEYGIKVLIKPHFLLEKGSPVDPHYCDKLAQQLKSLSSASLDGLIWESGIDQVQFEHHPAAEWLTYAELLQKELQLLEELIPKKTSLIFFLPKVNRFSEEQQGEWLLFLCDSPKKKTTTLAFSAVAGEPWEDAQRPHPFWEKLRCKIYPVPTPLLPLFNSGALQQGEGLWPTPPLELLDFYIPRMKRHHFLGALSLAPHIPPKGGMLDLTLWILAQALWQPASAPLLLERWCSCFKQEWHATTLAKIPPLRKIALDVARLQKKQVAADGAEKLRIQVEALFGQLQEMLISESEVVSSQISLGDYIRYFVRDARRILLSILQKQHIPITPYLTGADTQESFWTQAHLQEGAREALVVTFLPKPHRSKTDARLRAILEENGV